MVERLEAKRFLAIGANGNEHLQVLVVHRKQVRRQTGCHCKNDKQESACGGDGRNQESLVRVLSRKRDVGMEFRTFWGRHDVNDTKNERPSPESGEGLQVRTALLFFFLFLRL